MTDRIEFYAIKPIPKNQRTIKEQSKNIVLFRINTTNLIRT